MNRSFLVIQTAFTGDVILATSLLEKIHATHPEIQLDILVKKGNETLFVNHPYLRDVLVWDKKKNKYRNLFKLLQVVRQKKYDTVINVQRFIGTGILTAFSSARERIGFDKNPLSFLFTNRIKHIVLKGLHEVDRNQSMIALLTGGISARPRLYPSEKDFLAVNKFKNQPYVTIAPVSAWLTKTFPAYKWMELIKKLKDHIPGLHIYLIGSNEEKIHAEIIRLKSGEENITNLCGSLTYLESTALMKDANMNYVNDSAPLHLAGAINASVTVVYCSTIPDFGFGPLSDSYKIIETKLALNCRPCGLHGYKECPLVHFKCAHSIDITDEFLP